MKNLTSKLLIHFRVFVTLKIPTKNIHRYLDTVYGLHSALSCFKFFFTQFLNFSDISYFLFLLLWFMHSIFYDVEGVERVVEKLCLDSVCVVLHLDSAIWPWATYITYLFLTNRLGINSKWDLVYVILPLICSLAFSLASDSHPSYSLKEIGWICPALGLLL